MNNYEGDVKNAPEETAAADPVDRQMLAELMQMADSIKWNRPLEKVPLTIDTGENHDFLLKANNSGAGSSSEVEFLLRQVTPGFDETTQTNFALWQMLNNNGGNAEGSSGLN